ncbi:MAG: hypothetical protein ACOCXG_03980 [Nanoarchaeota archaeon]
MKKFKAAFKEVYSQYKYLFLIALFAISSIFFIVWYSELKTLVFINWTILSVNVGEDKFNSILKLFYPFLYALIVPILSIIFLPYFKRHKLFYSTIFLMLYILIFGIIVISIIDKNVLTYIGILFGTVLFSVPAGMYYLREIYFSRKE